MVVCIAASLLLASGCRALWPVKQPEPLPPTFAESELNRASVIDAINRNTDHVRQLEADVRITMSGIPTSISGTLVMERPSRLRLQAGVLGINDLGIDLGSNEELFWIWSKASMPGQTPSILYARHDEFANSPAGEQIRLQPRWIIDAFGLIEFSADEVHEGPFMRDDKRLEIRSHLSRGGKPYTRVTVIHPKYGWVEQLSLYNERGQLMAYANALDYHYDEIQQVSLPHFIELNVFPTTGEDVELTLQIKRVRLNSLYVDEERIWSMPDHADVPKIDLSKLPVNGTAPTGDPQPVRGAASRSTLHPRLHKPGTPQSLARHPGYWPPR